MPTSPFAPLTPEQLAEHRARRAEAEAEIARKEAALAQAEAGLASARVTVADMEAELEEISRLTSSAKPSEGQIN
jgi:hypothetical protein